MQEFKEKVMFESVRKWLDSLEEQSKLFDHAEDEAIHIALASLLYHIISVDNLTSEKEKHKFSQILNDEFNLKPEQIASLYSYVKTLQTDIHDDLKTIKEHLKENPHIRMTLMQKLIHLMSLDGVTDGELDIFHDAMTVVFPELVDKSELD